MNYLFSSVWIEVGISASVAKRVSARSRFGNMVMKAERNIKSAHGGGRWVTCFEECSIQEIVTEAALPCTPQRNINYFSEMLDFFFLALYIWGNHILVAPMVPEKATMFE
jgi:hypothetical protein